MALESRFYRQKGRVTMDENELMGSMKVSKAVAKMAIPSVISSLVTVVYNMADTFFVGQTGDPLQVAAVSQTNPILYYLWHLPICLVWAEAQRHLWHWAKRRKKE